MFKKRMLVALIFLPVFVGLIFLPNPLALYGLIYLSLSLATWELWALFKTRRVEFSLWIVLPAVWGIGLVANFHAGITSGWGFHASEVLWLVLIGVCLLLSLREMIQGHSEVSFINISTGIFTVLVLGGIGGFVFQLRQLPHGSWWLILLFGFNWIYDAGAMFIGTAFGRRLLAPKISPAKTVEGLCGGVLVNAAVAVVLFFTLLPRDMGLSLLGLVGLSVICSLLAQAGDLLESMVKRWTGSKDSAQYIPGHGGMLDKIDSTFFTAPVVYIIARLVSGA